MTKAMKPAQTDDVHHDGEPPVLLKLPPPLRKFMIQVAESAGVSLDTVIIVTLASHFVTLGLPGNKAI